MLESDKEQINKALKNKPSDQVKKIICFIDDALAFNKKHNIFVRSSPGEVLEKDILDCLPLIEKINKKEKILDLGSGGGFPGILLAILKPECEIHLLEKSQKNVTSSTKQKIHLTL